MSPLIKTPPLKTPPVKTPPLETITLSALFLLVFALAVAMRLPSCFESFWLDELHSAWCVWGSFDDVAGRATAGNQTPFYFWGLWFWRQVAGDGEVMLRLPSVIASSLAASIVSLGIHRSSGSAIAAGIGGLWMAIDKNAIFFGTELRPFAFVVLLCSVAIYQLLSPKKNYWSSALFWFCVAASVGLQPTSLGVVIWLMVAKCWRDRTSKPNSSVQRLVIFGSLAVISFLAAWFVIDVLATAWTHRSQWDAFASAGTASDLANPWPWGGIFGPLLLGIVIVALISRSRATGGSDDRSGEGNPAHRQFRDAKLLALLSVLSVATFWAISATSIAPVFHRRYFIASLPLIAWGGGEAVAFAIVAASNLKLRKRIAFLALAISPAVWILGSQGTVAKFMSDGVVVSRGEGWREAMHYISSNNDPSDTVLLTPGLIETKRLLLESPETAQQYLSFPLKGPYQWQTVLVTTSTPTRLDSGQAWLIRGSRVGAEQVAKQLGRAGDALIVSSFGNVQVLAVIPRN